MKKLRERGRGFSPQLLRRGRICWLPVVEVAAPKRADNLQAYPDTNRPDSNREDTNRQFFASPVKLCLPEKIFMALASRLYPVSTRSPSLAVFSPVLLWRS